MRCLWMEVTSLPYRQSLSRGDCVPPRYKPGVAFGHTRFDTPLACAQRKRLRPPRPQVAESSPGACPGPDFFLFYFRLRRKLCEANDGFASPRGVLPPRERPPD